MRPGDLVLVRGTGWLSKGILQATGCQKDGPSHIAVGINEKECVEALGSGVVRRPLVETLAGCERAWVLSFDYLSDAERQAIAHVAMGMVGLGYAYSELGLQLADSIFRTTWFTDRLSNLKNCKICSYVGAQCFDIVLGLLFDKEDQSVTPADIWRFGEQAVRLKEATTVRAV